MKQICNLIKLQLKNLYGINVFRYTKDKREKRKKLALAVAYLFIILMTAGYVGGLTFAYCYMGLAEMIPAYLIMVSSIVILFFTIFKAGSVIFQRNAYDILASLPIPQSAIVVSRFIRMYVENLMITAVVMLPAMMIYGVFQTPDISFYVIGLLVTIFIPLIPITIAVLFGSIVTAIASRMKHKSLVTAVCSIVVVAGIMFGSSQLSMIEDKMTLEMIQNLSETILNLIGNIYPPAAWLGNAMLTGDMFLCAVCIVSSLLLFAAVIVVVSANYYEISRRLYATNAKHDYQMNRLKRESILEALYKREWKRYFSSSVYVTNTIIGPMMGILFSIMILVIGIEETLMQIQMELGMELPFDIKGLIPFLLAGVFSMMPTTCTSISMEGKEWWIVKSLPIKTKDLLDSKILLYLSLVAPFLLISDILLIIALKPNIMEFLWMILVPVVMVIFSAVFGVAVNLKFPVFDWENEVTVVKQSAASFFGGLGGFLLVLLSMIPVAIVPQGYGNLMKLGICLVIIGITFILYKKNSSVNFQNL